MKMLRLFFICMLALCPLAGAQTIPLTFNDASTLAYAPCVPGGSAPCKVGENIGTVAAFDSSNNYKNVFGADNPGFEEYFLRQKLVQGVNAAANQLVFTFYTSGNTPTYPADTYTNYHADVTDAPYPFTSAEAGCSQNVTHSSPYPGIATETSATSFSITSNVVTIVASNTFAAGQYVVAGAPGATQFSTGSYLNGVLLLITSASSTQITAAFTHADVTSTTDSAHLAAQEVLTLASSCGAATQNGDIFTLTSPLGPTPDATWSASGGAYTAGGGFLTSDTTTPYDGAQSLIIDTLTSGAYVNRPIYADNDTHDRWRDITGTWQVSGVVKKFSGTGNFSVTIKRGGTSICSYSGTATTSWAQYQTSCTINEDSTLPAPGNLEYDITQGDQTRNDYDDIAFVKTSGQDATNTTNTMDEVYAAEEYFDGGNQTQWGMGRAWEVQNAETYANWVKPAGQAAVATIGDPVIYGNNAGVTNVYQLPDILARFQREHRIPYIVIPLTATDAELAQYVSYFTTTQSGMTQPWVGASGVFPTVHWEMGNEAWNNGFTYQDLPYRAGCVTVAGDCSTVDYLNSAGRMMKVIRAAPGYTSAIKLALNAQGGYSPGITTSAGTGSDWAYMVARGGAPDEVEINGYEQYSVVDFDTEVDQWRAAVYQPRQELHDTTSGYQQQVATLSARSQCGGSGTALCLVTVYEFGQNTWYTCGQGSAVACGGTHSATLTASGFTQMNQGAGQALVYAAQAIEQEQAGIAARSVFALNGYAGTNFGNFTHLWHVNVDMGGAAAQANAALFGNGGKFLPTPGAIGVSMYNAALIGTPFPCTSAVTYNFAASNNNSIPAFSGVPYLETSCHKDASGNRTMIVVNTDLVNSHLLTWTGSGAPTGTVTVQTFSPSSLNLTNESLGNTPTNTFTAQVGPPTTSSVTSPSSITIPAKSILSMSYTVGGGVTITVSPTTLTAGTVGAAYSHTLSASGGTSPYTFNTTVASGSLPSGLALSSSGVVSGTPTTAGTYTFTVSGVDSASNSFTSSTTTLVINVAAPIAGAASVSVAYNSSNNPVTLNLSGGTAASVAVATAASHGTATASGTSITYTPTTGFSGSDSFTYTATNVSGTSSPATVSVTVGTPTITVTPTTLAPGTISIAYSATLTASGGGSPYTFNTTVASGSLPPGLALSSSGVVSGTPTTAGTYTFTVSGTDAGSNAFTSATITLVISSSIVIRQLI